MNEWMKQCCRYSLVVSVRCLHQTATHFHTHTHNVPFCRHFLFRILFVSQIRSDTFLVVYVWLLLFFSIRLFNLWMCNHVFRLQSIRNKLKTWNNIESHGMVLCWLGSARNAISIWWSYSNRTSMSYIHCQNEIGPAHHPHTTFYRRFRFPCSWLFSSFYFAILSFAIQ